jgi:hypothetical protein
MWKLKKSQCLGFLADEMNSGKRKRKLPAQRAWLPGDVNMTIGSAFLPDYKSGLPANLPVKN